MRSSANAMALPMMIALNKIFIIMAMNINRMLLSVAPSALSTPMVFILLSTMIIRHAMIEKHATKAISPSTTAMLVFSKSSHAKWVGLLSRMVDSWNSPDKDVCPDVMRFVRRLMMPALTSSMSLPDLQSTPIYDPVLASHWFTDCRVFKFPIRICSSKVSKSVLKIPQIFHLRTLTCWLFIK